MLKFVILTFTFALVCGSPHHHHHSHDAPQSDHGNQSQSSEEGSHGHHHHHGSHSLSNPVDLSYLESPHNSVLNAPFHCHPEGWKVNEIPLKRLITRGSYVNLADLEPEEHKKDNFKLLPSHLEKWEEKFGKFANHSILLINFHWALHKTKDSNIKEFPSISSEAAEWIANSKKFVGIGIDTLHVDIDNSVTSPALHALHGSNIYILEKLNFEKITENLKHFYVVAVPLKYDVNDAAPVRVIAV